MTDSSAGKWTGGRATTGLWVRRTARASGRGHRREHLLHAGDLGRLIDVHVGRELEHRLVLPGALGAEQLLHHRDGAAMMLDHVSEEEPVELRAACGVELGELGVG